mmetsp:Transcript_74195/g.131002  ORF Transcript_74195/g.131002 Transcript_74195/m.131002 type:complete len:239 (-) Transcript_74195:18-734(-)
MGHGIAPEKVEPVLMGGQAAPRPWGGALLPRGCCGLPPFRAVTSQPLQQVQVVQVLGTGAGGVVEAAEQVRRVLGLGHGHAVPGPALGLGLHRQLLPLPRRKVHPPGVAVMVESHLIWARVLPPVDVHVLPVHHRLVAAPGGGRRRVGDVRPRAGGRAVAAEVVVAVRLVPVVVLPAEQHQAVPPHGIGHKDRVQPRGRGWGVLHDLHLHLFLLEVVQQRIQLVIAVALLLLVGPLAL